MQTNFSLAQLADPEIAESERILRSCVHCGFCTATCPTYVLLGDELDSPRGRIYLIKDMLENDRPAGERTVRHLDRCLSCLSCMSTCPSGVNYMHLVDHARVHIEKTYQRSPLDRFVRWALATVLPQPRLVHSLLKLAALGRLVAPILPRPLRAMLALASSDTQAPPLRGRRVYPAHGGPARRRVALLAGCVQQVVGQEINEATIRLLTRHGCEVVIADGSGCCGALTHHLGRADAARDSARSNIRTWIDELESEGLDAIVINASGCGTMVKDYGFLLRNDPVAKDAARIASLARDVSEVIEYLDLGTNVPPLRVAYHDPCSLRHGQKITRQPRDLLAATGFSVLEPPESHLCCGSAGTYNILQVDISSQLRDRKAANIASTGPEIVATGNIGCMLQLRNALDVPVVHLVQLLDWATGGSPPAELRHKMPDI